HSAEAVDVRSGRVQLERLVERAYGLHVFAAVPQRETQKMLCLRGTRLRTNRLLRVLACLREVSAGKRFRASLESRGIRVRAPRRPALLLQSLAERVICFLRLGVQLQRRFERPDRAIQVPLLPQRLTILIMQVRAIAVLIQ